VKVWTERDGGGSRTGGWVALRDDKLPSAGLLLTLPPAASIVRGEGAIVPHGRASYGHDAEPRPSPVGWQL